MDIATRNKRSTELLLEVAKLINAHGNGGDDNQQIREQATAVGHVAIQVSSTGRLKGNQKIYRQHSLTIAVADIEDITVRLDGPGKICFGPYLLIKFNKPVMVRNYMFHVGMESLDVPPRWQESAWEDVIIYADSDVIGKSIREKLISVIESNAVQVEQPHQSSLPAGSPIVGDPGSNLDSDTFRIVEEED